MGNCMEWRPICWPLLSGPPGGCDACAKGFQAKGKEERLCANGPYAQFGENHGRPSFKHRDHQLMIYYWDDRDGVKWSGWWLGPHVGGDKVWSFNSSQTLLPPERGWQVPWNGPVDSMVQLQVNPVAKPKQPSTDHSAVQHLGKNIEVKTATHGGATSVPRKLNSGHDLAPAVLVQEFATECSVCLEPLWSKEPSVFMQDGKRLCPHAFCRSCAEAIVRLQGGQRLKVSWAAPLKCPVCRTGGVALVCKVPDVCKDPRGWFELCNVTGNGELSKFQMAWGLACVLPTNVEVLLKAFEAGVWAQWCMDGPEGYLSLDNFMRSGEGSPLAWIVRHVHGLHRKESSSGPLLVAI